MSGEVLRRAAALMRERANGATAGPWEDCSDSPASCVYSPTEDVFVTSPMDWDAGGGDTEHMASWHPVVALAVADWLDADAAVIERHGLDATVSRAYDVACAYLGSASGGEDE